MKPEHHTIFIIMVMVIVQGTLPGMEIEGQTVSGMEFSGRIRSIQSGVLHLSSPDGGRDLAIGIPMDSLAFARIDIRKPHDADLANRLETVVPLLPALDQQTRAALLEWIRSLGEAGDWPGVYLWAGRLMKAGEYPEIRNAAALLEAQALHKMGLHRELGLKLASLNEGIEPLEAPPLLCRLNAAFWKQEGDPEKAIFWKELPRLQIPSHTDTQP